ncbi:hypothetical protein FFWV33_07720 [Flavobacterium faecale]|uniref:Glycosyltransferase 2-like domain-containing protein n=1 Tax=Flavobacterium faecale TaxID=1355330 RepID=A0A2S1LD10_9FLAO|nr:glycosyltransferase [Flavobacterium faecale]AWG21426.1 hypothetical protein FFWV33_07720 [Flavobacterium faecale]
MTTFSIIMPAYNVGLFIEESIESVLNQTYPHFELIIIDDGSTDNTFNLISNNKDPRVKVLQQVNKGVSSARNNGISNSSNGYIAFLDSDDIWSSDKLQNIVDAVGSEIGIYYSNALEFVNDINTAVPSRYTESIEDIDNRNLILIYDFIILSTAVVPSKIIKEFNGFSEDLNGTEDWDLWIRIGQKYDFKKIKKFDCYYRMNENGLSKNRKAHLLSEYKVIEKHLLNSNLGNRKVKNLSLWVWYKKNFYYHLMNYEIVTSFKFFALMLWRNPFSFSNFDFCFRILRKIF